MYAAIWRCDTVDQIKRVLNVNDFEFDLIN